MDVHVTLQGNDWHQELPSFFVKSSVAGCSQAVCQEATQDGAFMRLVKDDIVVWVPMDLVVTMISWAGKKPMGFLPAEKK